jgi:hypothetical protein
MPYDVHLKSDFQRADAGVMQRGKRVAQCAAKSEEKVGGASGEARVARKRRGEVLEENGELGVGSGECNWGEGDGGRLPRRCGCSVVMKTSVSA